MSYNPQYGAEPWFGLPGIRAVRLSGRDAVAFAQSQFMNDVAALADDAWQWNGWLDPKGRVKALFALIRLDGETLLLVTPADVDTLVDALGRFVFRSKVRIEHTAIGAVGQLARPAVARAGVLARTVDGPWELDLSGGAGARVLRLVDDGGDLTANDPARELAWWALDVAHGWPALPGVTLEAWTPQQLSLQRLGAFSVRKGCYPGQEIVARTHFLGRVKRGLARVRGTGLAAGGEVLGADGRAVGQVACVAGNEALVVVPLEPADPALFASGQPLDLLPLADGLER